MNEEVSDGRKLDEGMVLEEDNKRIVRNAVKCNHCSTVIESTHVHDFVACGCDDTNDQVCVDGGLDYIRLVFGKNASWVDLSETIEG